jgi:hypothetical protein
MACCQTCGADWSEDKFTQACVECGGGAMTIQCPACQGACGSTWQRAAIDSNDSGSAHFYGNCTLEPTGPKRGRGDRV